MQWCNICRNRATEIGGIMSLFLTADLHFNHGNIMKYCRRPGLSKEEQKLLDSNENFKVSWDSVERMNNYLLDGINKIVGLADTLWILGDFCFGSRDKIVNTARRFRGQIKCKNVHLIWGNHDNYAIAEFFASTHHMETIKYKNQKVVLNHYAMAIWNKSHHGVCHAYGHSHARAEEYLNKAFPGRRSMDIGVDNAAIVLGEYRPFRFEEYMEIMDSNSGCVIDHHG
ncbi:MAG: hypothetical protein DWQ19_10465 [Crenarchaeota archaeon]|nr:MAG: hypothetical protein DWQ19_10465 [Thermoproteota archaeon]